jgi:hypothetical protein
MNIAEMEALAKRLEDGIAELDRLENILLGQEKLGAELRKEEFVPYSMRNHKGENMYTPLLTARANSVAALANLRLAMPKAAEEQFDHYYCKNCHGRVRIPLPHKCPHCRSGEGFYPFKD